MPQPWPSREVEVILPIATVKAMFERARRFDVERSGRFDARGSAVLLGGERRAVAPERVVVPVGPALLDPERATGLDEDGGDVHPLAAALLRWIAAILRGGLTLTRSSAGPRGGWRGPG